MTLEDLVDIKVRQEKKTVGKTKRVGVSVNEYSKILCNLVSKYHKFYPKNLKIKRNNFLNNLLFFQTMYFFIYGFCISQDICQVIEFCFSLFYYNLIDHVVFYFK